MTTVRWNDDRLDDMHNALEANSKRTADMGMVVAAHELTLGEINRERSSQRDQRWALLLVIVTIVVGQAVNVALTTLHPAAKPSVITVRVAR